ncbi:MAG TPA: (2Fe-2S) ferredoxin domain-containing protein [Deltaproteobacteria bacterium]|nr:(2Fe-2S) ferredoxin domain-containing protein [Deltaproteobacteria bacterium]HPJ94632.1 (2Fe-2S) ferredoxin domain-containing protein [Deltaproteobacteria bacterium]HPR52511.1 (2Fe-2S) ferredoxin domain-containing protein [Deltaproteobacteria bacterium]
MAKLTINDLKKIKERVEKEDQFRAGTKRVKITVHMGTCGIASGAKQILDTFMDEISESNADDVIVTTSGCIGICSREPLATVEEQGKEPIVYEYLTQNKARQIFKRHVINGEIQNEFVLARGREQEEKGESK